VQAGTWAVVVVTQQHLGLGLLESAMGGHEVVEQHLERFPGTQEPR
jgi:hypothetical protein